MQGLPSGTVTFLFTDIEGSTRLLQDLGDAYEPTLAEHRRLLREAFEAHAGHEMGTEGDSFFVAFARASDGLAAALAGQLAVGGHDWAGRPVRVRMGLHTGEARLVDGDYVGLAVHQAARVSSAAHGGQVLVSQTTRDLVASSIPEGASLVDLGEHRLKDLAQPVRLYNLAHVGLPAEVPSPRTLSVLPNNLPLQLTTFIGRDEQITKIHKLLESTRLLTLCGAGGSGKTRLGLQVAAELITEHRDGVWLADLSPLTEGELIVRGIAEALGVREEKDRDVEDVLIEHLQGKDLLVVVDNCEHMAEASAATIDRLLHAASALRIIATSREPLGAEGETVFRVPTLDTPKGDEPPEALSDYESVRLFCDRAARATTEFSLDATNARAVAEICERLDGMPLAIELAAARVRMITPQEIAKRLDDRFKLLTGGLRTGIRRQQTLRAAVDWSYEMLSEAERLLFRRLSVFVGGFTLEAAEGVCSGEGIDEFEVLDLLGNLVDRSLVLAEPHDGTTRYRLLETMREYGREMLAASDEAPMIWSRHLEWFAQLAEDAFDELYGAGQSEWLKRIDTELDNVRQALSWATNGGDRLSGLRLASSLMKYWHIRWYVREGARWLGALLDGTEKGPPAIMAKGLLSHAFLSANADSWLVARPVYERVVAMRNLPGTDRFVAEALNDLGLVVWGFDQDLQRARALLEEALEIRRAIGFDSGIRESLNNIAQLASWTGDRVRARALLEEALDIARRVGAQDEVAFQLSQIAQLHDFDGDLDAAEPLLWEALQIQEELRAPAAVAGTLVSIAAVARQRGDYDEAEELYQRASDLVRDQDNLFDAALVDRWTGHIALERGDFERARALFTEAVEHVNKDGQNIMSAFVADDMAHLERAIGNVAEARQRTEHVLVAMKATGHLMNLPLILARAAVLAIDEDDLDAARAHIDEAVAIARASNSPRRIASAEVAAAALAVAEGRRGDAVKHERVALELRFRCGLMPDVARSLETLGQLYDEGTAATLLGAAEALRAASRIVLPPIDRSKHDEAIARGKAALGEQAFEAAWAKGASMLLDDVVALALED